MFSFCRHVTTAPLRLQRYFSSTKSILNAKDAKVDRHNLTPFRMKLESVYEDDHYPSLERREIVAKDLRVPIHSISLWFKRRRIADKITRSLHGQDTSEFRGRSRCTDEQLKILWDQCARNLYPNDSEMMDLVERLGMDKPRIIRLLSNLRYRARQGSVPANLVVTTTPPKVSRLPSDKFAILEDHFQRDPYPKTTGTFDALVQKLGLSPSKVNYWFKDRRRRQRENPARPLTKVMDELQIPLSAGSKITWFDRRYNLFT
ncbi:hypothetical protein CPB85DRAFT_1559159 [Mucidula mucida]|nr:hypothetical protein CPB85DRAFT_1559159 [Mucidula mucida]